MIRDGPEEARAEGRQDECHRAVDIGHPLSPEDQAVLMGTSQRWCVTQATDREHVLGTCFEAETGSIFEEAGLKEPVQPWEL